MTEETGQPHNGEIGEISKTEAQEKQESSNSSTQNNEQDEHHSEMHSTENLVIKHVDSEAMVTTEKQKENEEATDNQSHETAKESMLTKFRNFTFGLK